jgi:hypothetical protein
MRKLLCAASVSRIPNDQRASGFESQIMALNGGLSLGQEAPAETSPAPAAFRPGEEWLRCEYR